MTSGECAVPAPEEEGRKIEGIGITYEEILAKNFQNLKVFGY